MAFWLRRKIHSPITINPAPPQATIMAIWLAITILLTGSVTTRKNEITSAYLKSPAPTLNLDNIVSTK